MHTEKKRASRWWIAVVAAVVLIAAGVAVWLTVVRPLQEQAARTEAALAALQADEREPEEKAATPAPTPAPTETPTPEPTPVGPYTSRIMRSYDSSGAWRATEERDHEGLLLLAQDKTGAHEEFRYNGQGNLLVHSVFGASGDLSSTTEYQYDEGGRETAKIVYRYTTGEKKMRERTLSAYDAYGNLLRKETCDQDGEVYKWEDHTYTYDDAGRVLKDVGVSTHISDGTETETTTNKYDGSGNLVEYNYTYISKLSWDNTSWRERETYEYDEAGNLIVSLEYYNGRLGWRNTYAYDENGVRRKYVREDMEELESGVRWEYEYDENGVCRKKTTYGLSGGRKLVEYDENGVELGYEREYDADGRLLWEKTDFYDKIEYQYNENGLPVREDYYTLNANQTTLDHQYYVEYEYVY